MRRIALASAASTSLEYAPGLRERARHGASGPNKRRRTSVFVWPAFKKKPFTSTFFVFVADRQRALSAWGS